jgi:ABC-type polysaccharide/polyol phosphate export permease
MFQRMTQLSSYRELILSFVLRDVKEKYQGTILGYFWALLMPLPTMLSLYPSPNPQPPFEGKATC